MWVKPGVVSWANCRGWRPKPCQAAVHGAGAGGFGRGTLRLADLVVVGAGQIIFVLANRAFSRTICNQVLHAPVARRVMSDGGTTSWDGARPLGKDTVKWGVYPLRWLTGARGCGLAWGAARLYGTPLAQGT